MLHIPYRGEGPTLVDLMAGQVQVMLAPLATLAPNTSETVEWAKVMKLAGIEPE